MKYFIEEGNGKKVIIRLDSGDMLLESIEQVIAEANIKDGAVEIYPVWNDVPMELSSISGIIADYMPHLHIVFSSPEKTFSGHLEHGCKTLYLCEIVIEVFEKLELQRRKNSKGIMELEKAAI